MFALLLLVACGPGPADTTTCATEPLTPACREATNAMDCGANGGCWGTAGLSNQPICTCATTDAGEPCASDDDCEGVCVGAESDTGCSPDGGVCAAVTPLFGCRCAVYDDGFAMLCVD